MLRLCTRIAAIAAMSTVASVGSLAVASGVASATSPAATCTKFNTNLTGDGTVSGCTDPANTGGKGTVKTVSGKGTITWNKTGTTKITAKDTVEKTDTKCTPKTDTEIKITATVTGGTGAALKSLKVGQSSTFYVCANTKTKTVALAPGQKAGF